MYGVGRTGVGGGVRLFYVRCGSHGGRGRCAPFYVRGGSHGGSRGGEVTRIQKNWSAGVALHQISDQFFSGEEIFVVELKHDDVEVDKVTNEDFDRVN